jgi:hypothetical protein
MTRSTVRWRSRSTTNRKRIAPKSRRRTNEPTCPMTFCIHPAVPRPTMPAQAVRDASRVWSNQPRTQEKTNADSAVRIDG